MHLPTNSWEHNTFFFLSKIASKSFVSIDAYCKASLIRTTNKTITGWEPLWLLLLQKTASEQLDLLHLVEGDLCTKWWDTKPFVHYLACAYYGLEQFHEYKQCCVAIRRIQNDPDNKKSIQALAHKAILLHNGGYDFYPLLHRRCSPLGLSSIAVISRSDVQRAFQCACDVSHVAAMAWFKTVTNAWCTSSRMHESSQLQCIFGCRDCKDMLGHYVECNILWSILHESFGGVFPPSKVSRLNYQHPSQQNIIVISAAFEIYHALKIGLRHIVDDSQATQRFAEIIRIASKLAVESRTSHANVLPEHFNEYSGTSFAQVSNTTKRFIGPFLRRSTAHIPRSNVGALHSLPRRQLYHSNMRTPIGPRTPTGPITFTRADHIDFCPSWLGIPTATDPDSDLDA